jgi:ABC-type bacteriocin/lantibiotic exporter with double-glycine peptidase domain
MSFLKYYFVVLALVLSICLTTFWTNSQAVTIQAPVDCIKNPSATGCGTVKNVCDSSYFGNNSQNNNPFAGQCEGRNNNSGNFVIITKDFLNWFNNLLLVLAPICAVIALLVGAYMIMFRGLQVGIVIVQWALIGVVAVLLSFGLISLLIQVLTSLSSN